jgi:hypothetical protein
MKNDKNNPYSTDELKYGFLGSVASPSIGCPITIGILLRVAVFTLIFRYMMDL